MTFQKFELPSAVEVDGRFYKIHTDFQFSIIFIKLVNGGNLNNVDFDFMFTEKVPRNKQGAMEALIKWLYPPKELPRPIDEQNDEIMLDYDLDAELIYAAFYEKYHIDLFEKDLHLHWYKFQALLKGLQGTKLNEVMRYRSYKVNNKDSAEYKKGMLKMKEMWRIAPQLTEEEKQAVAKFDSQLK